jgi:hypothetical protein
MTQLDANHCHVFPATQPALTHARRYTCTPLFSIRWTHRHGLTQDRVVFLPHRRNTRIASQQTDHYKGHKRRKQGPGNGPQGSREQGI